MLTIVKLRFSPSYYQQKKYGKQYDVLTASEKKFVDNYIKKNPLEFSAIQGGWVGKGDDALFIKPQDVIVVKPTAEEVLKYGDKALDKYFADSGAWIERHTVVYKRYPLWMHHLALNHH